MDTDTRARTLSLFSGCGLIDLALAPWCRTVAYCEHDPFACGVLMSRMADGQLQQAPIWDNVATLRPQDLAGIGPIELIAAGFPCTDISLAGTGEGLAGDESGLWREVARLADALRPPFVFLENVPAIRKRGASDVVGDLARLGYDCRWTAFRASDIGAPHKRDRWFLFAAHADSFAVREQPEREQPEREQCGPSKWRDTFAGEARVSRRVTQAVASNTNGGRLAKHRSRNNDNRSQPRWNDIDRFFALPTWEAGGHPEPALRGMDDGGTNRVDELRLLGGSVVPAQCRLAFQILSGLVSV